MCGIAGIINNGVVLNSERCKEKLDLMLLQMKHRGDAELAHETKVWPSAAIGCNRLAIVDREFARQPLTDEQGTIFAVLNGEIYNYRDLYHELVALGHRFKTLSDTEVLVHGYQEWGEDITSHLDGMFGFILYDSRTNIFLAARDHIGIKPLYYLYEDNTYFIASEMKALLPLGQKIQVLQPGHYLTFNGIKRYFHFPKDCIHVDESEMISTFRDHFIRAVKKMVQTDLPIGVIFSGGLDSAAVLSIAARYHSDVTAFTVGFAGAPDIEVARRYCQENGIRQHIAYLQADAMINDFRQIIYYGETFETIDIMDASVLSPAFKLAQEAGIKVVLCGDGSDEVLAGYDFFKSYPNPDYLMTYRLNNLHRTDLQRVDRSSMRYTVEARVPFMDKPFLCYSYSLPMSLKLRNGVEKWILREALREYLPDYISQRPKIRMPEGSGLHYQLLDFAHKQGKNLKTSFGAELHIEQPDVAYFLDQYIQMGYPLPQERYKKPVLDFAENGYFKFTKDT
ncbi:asparagine synthetase B [Reticulibacter mediterranei]|uniref:asparagine synthase (glutamine-hydrolyzing) n=1 Tax=Reticulibacter mediterranei TaxID=2778369 RepID=A0A8J3II91_9CHLR|nr:asparagine synthase-related protein [Reticulibacter mediterranei]GHO95051.1 asparagine synthetase B [Reticulibacter mediterranei]